MKAWLVLGLSIFGVFATEVWAGPLYLKAATMEAKSVAGLPTVGADARLFVVQWKKEVQEVEKQKLLNLGAEILDYIPEQAFLIKADRAIAGAIETLSFIESVLPYRPEWKVDPNYSKQSLFKADQEVRLAVELADPQAAAELNPLFQTPLIHWQGRTYLGTVVGAAVPQIAANPLVIWVEEWLPIKALDFDPVDKATIPARRERPALTGFESGSRIVGAEALYAAGFNGRGQIVGYCDTGLDTGDLNNLHQDFRGQIRSAYAIAPGGSSWGDPQAHGTHVAGSIAGNGRQSGEQIRGAAWGAQLVVEGMWSDLMDNLMPPAVDIIFGKAFQDGARIHSNSWGRNVVGAYDGLARSVDQYLYDNPDFLAVFAAGNNGADLDRDGVVDEGSIVTPATAKNIVTIGASKNVMLSGGIQKPMRELREGARKWGVEPLASSVLSDDQNGMAAFSSRGPTSDGRIKPELVAPGTNIVSTRSRHPRADVGWGVFDDHYLYMGGTSMATPLSSGSLALLRQVLVERLQQTNPSAALVKAFAVNGALDLFPGQFGVRAQGQEQPTPRPNNHEGWGRIHLPAALAAEAAFRFVDDRQGLATGQEATFELASLAPGTPVRVTMTYTDAPAANAAAVALVNDLDLEVRSPSGAIAYPNRRTSRDNKNNLEHIDFQASEAGTYQVVVRGRNVPSGRQGKQAFALVMFANPARH